jgi:hypothetical protein
VGPTCIAYVNQRGVHLYVTISIQTKTSGYRCNIINPATQSAGRATNLMARVAVVCLFLITLGVQVAIVSAMPPPRPSKVPVPMHSRLQCPQCTECGFGSVSSLHKHCANFIRRTECGLCWSDMSQPLHSGWSGRGPRTAGTAQDLSRAQTGLPCLTDSDSDSSSWDGDPGRPDLAATVMKEAGHRHTLKAGPPVRLLTKRYHR